MATCLWFPNDANAENGKAPLTAVSYSQHESLADVDIELQQQLQEEMKMSVAAKTRSQTAPRRSGGAAFVAGGTQPLTRTPPTHQHKAMPMEEDGKDTSTATTPITPLSSESTPTNALLSTALRRARERRSNGHTPPPQPPTPGTPTTAALDAILKSPVFDKENCSPMMNMEHLSPLRFPAGARTPSTGGSEVRKPSSRAQSGTNATTTPISISASPLAVCVGSARPAIKAAVPFAPLTTPIRVPLGPRAQTQTPASADPRVEALKGRVQSLLKSQTKKPSSFMAMPTPTIKNDAARKSLVTPKTQASESLIPSVEEMALTPYSAAVEASINQAGIEDPQWEKKMLEQTPMHPTTAQTKTSDKMDTNMETDETSKEISIVAKSTSTIAEELDAEMETVPGEEVTGAQVMQNETEEHEASSAPSVEPSSPVQAPKATAADLASQQTPISSKVAALHARTNTLTPHTASRQERAIFSRDLIASITSTTPPVAHLETIEEVSIPAAPAMIEKKAQVQKPTITNKVGTFERDLLTNITTPTAPKTDAQPEVESPAHKAHGSNWMKILFSMLIVLLVGGAAFLTLHTPPSSFMSTMDASTAHIEESVTMTPIAMISELNDIEITSTVADAKIEPEIETEAEIEAASEPILPAMDTKMEEPVLVSIAEMDDIAENTPATESESLPEHTEEIDAEPIHIDHQATAETVADIEKPSSIEEQVPEKVESEPIIEPAMVEDVGATPADAEIEIESASAAETTEDGASTSQGPLSVTRFSWSPDGLIAGDAEDDLFDVSFDSVMPEAVDVLQPPSGLLAPAKPEQAISAPQKEMVVEQQLQQEQEQDDIEKDIPSELATAEPVARMIEEAVELAPSSSAIEPAAAIEPVVEKEEASIKDEKPTIDAPAGEISEAVEEQPDPMTSEQVTQVEAETSAEAMSGHVEPASEVVTSAEESNSNESWSMSSTAAVVSLIGACILGAFLQSSESASPIPTSPAAIRSPAPATASTPSVKSVSPFSWSASKSKQGPTSTSTAASAGQASSNKRISLSPLRPVRKIHFTPEANEKSTGGVSNTPSPSPSALAFSPAPFSGLESRLASADNAVRALAQTLAAGGKLRLDGAAPPPLRELNEADVAAAVNPRATSSSRRPTTELDQGQRLHVDVPMMLSSNGRSFVSTVVEEESVMVEAAAPLPPSTRSARQRRTTRSSMASVSSASSSNVPTPAAAVRRSARLSRRMQ